jgi:hypothetical protein
MRLHCGPGSSLGDTLLAASLKALTTDQPSTELVTPAVACEPLCLNHAARTALLVVPAPHRPPVRANRRVSSLMMTRYRSTMTSLCRSGYGNFLTLGRWCSMRRSRLTRRPRTKGSWRRPRRRGLRTRGPWRRQQLPRRLLAKLRTGPQKLPGAHRPPVRHPQRPRLRGLRLQAAPPRQPNVTTGVFGNLGLSSFLSPFSPFFQWGFILLLHFLPRSSPSGAATVTGTTASAIGTATADATVGVTPGPAPDGQPRTPEGVPEDMVEDSEGEPEVAPESVPEVVREEAPAEGALITVRVAVAPPPSRGA